MANMRAFCTWFLQQIPSFLMSEPICYLVGFMFAGLTIWLISRLLNIK